MVVGGRNENQELLATTEELDVSSWFWKSLSNITDGKSHHCQVNLSLILDIVVLIYFQNSIKRKYLGEKLYQSQIKVFTILNLMVPGKVGQIQNYHGCVLGFGGPPNLLSCDLDVRSRVRCPTAQQKRKSLRWTLSSAWRAYLLLISWIAFWM